MSSLSVSHHLYDMTSPYPAPTSPAGLSPGLAQTFSPGNKGPATPETPFSAHGLRPSASTRPGGSSSHLNPALSTRMAPTSQAGSVRGPGSIAATSIHHQQANPEDFEKALDEFVKRQLPEFERLLAEVVGGM